MNSFIKLILGWESQADHDDWVQAFRTASTLITAHRSGSLGVASSASSSQAQQTSKSDSPATAQVLASTPQILSSPSNHQVAAASPSQSSPVSATNSANESQSQSGASPSPGGSAKAYQRRGSLTVGNNAAAEKREQEKAEAEAEKRALLDKVNGLASCDIEALIEETSRNLQMVSGEERFNPRKQTLEDVLPVLKDKLVQALNAEKLIEEQSSRLSAACELELQKFVVDASLSSDQRIEMQSQLQLYLSQLEGDLRNFKDSKFPSSKIIQVHESNMQAISTRIRQWIELEQTIEAKLKNIIAAKMKFMDTIGASSIEEVAQLESLYQDLLVKETNPEVRQILSQIVTICTEKLATEQRLEKEAIQFVEGGIFLKKYARDKVMKKSRHEPVSSVVKCVSGTLLWGSHKTGPKIHHVACGPSELLRSSGILMSRLVYGRSLC